MITMEMLGKIRRMYLRDKMSLHAIAKQTGLSRNTLRRWLREPDEAAVPTYQRTPGTRKLTRSGGGFAPFHAVGGVNHHQSRVDRSEHAVGVFGKVLVARSVEQVDDVAGTASASRSWQPSFRVVGG